MRSIVREEGFRGLWKGFGTNSLNLAVGQVYITIFEYLKTPRVFGKHTPEEVRTALAACTAVMTAQTLANPIDILAQRLMVQRGDAPPPTNAPGSGTSGEARRSFHTAIRGSPRGRNAYTGGIAGSRMMQMIG